MISCFKIITVCIQLYNANSFLFSHTIINTHFKHLLKYSIKYSTKLHSYTDTQFVENKLTFNKYTPKSENQQNYVNILQNKSIPFVVVIGPAGSGKTMFACMEAIKQLQLGVVDKIVLTRPLISVEEEELGFLPGSIINKMDPWTRPMFDIFREIYTNNEINIMIKNGIIEIAPLAFMRGRTFHNTFVVADEMQNSSPAQMLMLSTRVGTHSKMIVTGDLQQSDRDSVVPIHQANGLADFLQKFRNWQKLKPTHSNITLDSCKDGYNANSKLNNNNNNKNNKNNKNNNKNNKNKNKNFAISAPIYTNTINIEIVTMDKKDVFRSPLLTRILEIYDTPPKSIVANNRKNHMKNNNISTSYFSAC